LSLRRTVLALGRAVLALRGAVGRLRLLGVAAAATAAAVVILSRHDYQKKELLLMRLGCAECRGQRFYREEGEITARSGKKRRERRWMRGESVLRPRNVM
jgi:hypothetical protein